MCLGVDVYRDSKTGQHIHVSGSSSYSYDLIKLERGEGGSIFLYNKDITEKVQSLNHVTFYTLTAWIEANKPHHMKTISMREFLKKGENN